MRSTPRSSCIAGRSSAASRWWSAAIPHGRGVVATASYEARKHGIRSAMSSAEALRRCPDVVFVRPDHREYRDWSRRVWGLVGELAPVVEQIGIDEGYLVLPDGDPPEQAACIQQAIRAQVRLSSSLGVASCKVVAKIASDMRKPGGIMYVPSGEEAAFLAPLDVRKLPGVGPKSERRLRDAGIQTIGALASLDDGRAARAAARARWGRSCATAPGGSTRGSSPASRPRRSRCRSRRRSSATSTTAASCTTGCGRWPSSWRRRCAARSWSRGRSRLSSAIPDFSIVTRSQSAAVGFDDAERIATLACALLDRALDDRPDALRLIGVGVSGFERHVQLTLLDG